MRSRSFLGARIRDPSGHFTFEGGASGAFDGTQMLAQALSEAMIDTLGHERTGR